MVREWAKRSEQRELTVQRPQGKNQLGELEKKEGVWLECSGESSEWCEAKQERRAGARSRTAL